MDTADLLEEALKNLKSTGGIEATAVISRDGLVMKAKMPSKQKPETLAAMSATMLGAAETATIELGKGIPHRVIAETENGKLIAMGAGPKAVLVIITDSDIGLGLILIEAEKAASKIKEILG